MLCVRETKTAPVVLMSKIKIYCISLYYKFVFHFIFIFLVDKQTNGVGTIRRVCSLVDLSSSTPIKDCQPYNTFNGGGK